jgi:hypothetical protein
MPSINTPASKHAGPAATMGWQWLPYTTATMLAALRRAIHIIDVRIKGSKPCNAAFKALPSGRTFAQVWSDPSIWINCDPDRIGHRFGVTHSLGGTHNISITQYALSMGEWTTAATLIHELAHNAASLIMRSGAIRPLIERGRSTPRFGIIRALREMPARFHSAGTAWA